MTTRKLLLAILVAACASPQFLGCHLVGLGRGLLSSANSQDQYIFTPATVSSIEYGSAIEVTKTDGTLISGHFERLDAAPSDEYSVRYKASINSRPTGLLLPALGDTVLIVTHSAFDRKIFTGELLGFEQEMICLHIAGGWAPVGVLLEEVDTLCHPGMRAIPGAVLRQELDNGDIPSMNALVMTTEQGSLRVFVTDILKVRQPVSKRVALLNQVLAAAVDVSIVIGILSWFGIGFASR